MLDFATSAGTGAACGPLTGVFMLKSLAALAALSLAAAGCARPPEKVEASYVSPVLYQSLSCEQLAMEATRVSARAAELAGVQRDQQRGDAVATGVGLILFWPALFLIGGDDAQTAEFSRVKGEMQAIEQASIAGNCGIVFQPIEPPPPKPKPRHEQYPLNR